ncbi:hypothetical protein [Roseicyclus sp.]|uniref:hypothetical protein n=1 Tax=Roseicyclus sp. TaxID=1914329 RepID=UPI003F6AB4C6
MKPKRQGGKVTGAWFGHCRAIAICLALLPAPVAADIPWVGPYLEVGIGLTDNRLSLSQNHGVVDGVAIRQGLWRSDAGFVALGYGHLRGALRVSAEIEAQIGSRPMVSGGSCRLGRVCARSNLIGTLGPIYRLRARLGRAIAPGVAVSVGLGLSAAEINASRALVQVASATTTGAALVRASSPFVVDDLARGGHVVLGINQALSARVTWGLSLLHERLHVASDSAVSITAATMSGPSRAMVQLDHRGDFTIESRALRLSLTWRF